MWEYVIAGEFEDSRQEVLDRLDALAGLPAQNNRYAFGIV